MVWRSQVPITGKMKQAARAARSWIWSSELAAHVAAEFWGAWMDGGSASSSSGSNGVGSPGAWNPLSSRRMAWAERYQSLVL